MLEEIKKPKLYQIIDKCLEGVALAITGVGITSQDIFCDGNDQNRITVPEQVLTFVVKVKSCYS